MSTIINHYVGITHPIKEIEDKESQELILAAWKMTNCINGIHLFDECLSIDNHYLYCDACGIEVHIKKIVIPDGKDNIIEKIKNENSSK